jgi:hypothetical protein
MLEPCRRSTFAPHARRRPRVSDLPGEVIPSMAAVEAQSMRAQDLASYFAKKIAKPIAYTYRKPDPVYAADRNYVA